MVLVINYLVGHAIIVHLSGSSVENLCTILYLIFLIKMYKLVQYYTKDTHLFYSIVVITYISFV